MVDHRQVKVLSVLHRSTHDSGIWNRPPIIGYSDGSGGLHLAHFGQLAAIG